MSEPQATVGQPAGEEPARQMSKLRTDVLWNVASLGVLGVGGVLLNILIAVFYGASDLGIFNEVYAIYIVFAQFAVGGVHWSALKHVAQHTDHPRRCAAIIAAALALGVLFAAASSLVFWLSRPLCARVLGDANVATGMAWATLGLFFFSINKVLMAVLNGYRRMKLYAVFSALRPVLMVAALGGIILAGWPGSRLAGIFSASEIVLFIGLGTSVRRHLGVPRWRELKLWIGTHLPFGAKSFASGMLMELNTRVDVLMLGYFTSARLVGGYSLGATLAEGLSQLSIVFRTNFNPLLTRYLTEGRGEELRSLFRKGKRAGYLAVGGVGALAILLFPHVVGFVTRSPDFRQSWLVFAILTGGIIVTAGYTPFGQILIQGGRPGWHCLMTLAAVLFNVLFNGLFIPVWGLAGAAVATALALCFSVVLINILAYRFFGVRI
ncbi:MAG: polysaccharide biosynthesis C-terminal domain-containing protein [Phycisphaerae bacterium]|nr:polysaccharide biosynthesis C-terminal domain-containing protein [Phycisphaerae bacterium]